LAKSTAEYICQQCGSSHPKWSGKCLDCGAWNSLVEEHDQSVPKGVKGANKASSIEFVGLDGPNQEQLRKKTTISELDRVTGGGLVPGSVVLVGGDPGIGKSTLLLQAIAGLSKNYKCAYISGEEGVDQVRLRAKRLHVENQPVELATETNIKSIIKSLNGPTPPEIVVIDSIQTMYLDDLDSSPGSVSQVRTCSQELIRLAKKKNIVMILVGHVTKEGAIAGPRVLEHMVDTVLYFEGDRGHQFRILRSVKNRFGPTDEIGVFEMTSLGLQEVSNPSAIFLENRHDDINGSAVFAGIEGTRPVLVEIQSLVAPSPFASPRRNVIGWDSGRLAMIIAVLESRCGMSFAGKDVYLNIAGGLRISEPAADLAVAAALLSSLTAQPIPAQAVLFGEIGLSGEIRSVSQPSLRLKEAEKLGFSQAYIPKLSGKESKGMKSKIEIKEVKTLIDLIHELGIPKLTKTTEAEHAII
tara:strand:+ start:27389 stop:28795 length:1407 start_codon:yes stop_codon:yes gene_type:complete